MNFVIIMNSFFTIKRLQEFEIKFFTLCRGMKRELSAITWNISICSCLNIIHTFIHRYKYDIYI